MENNKGIEKSGGTGTARPGHCLPAAGALAFKALWKKEYKNNGEADTAWCVGASFYPGRDGNAGAHGAGRKTGRK